VLTMADTRESESMSGVFTRGISRALSMSIHLDSGAPTPVVSVGWRCRLYLESMPPGVHRTKNEPAPKPMRS
jgi:hypothetical protein